MDSILLPKVIANLPWSEARLLLQTKYDLSIDETAELFCAKYMHDSRLWTRGTEEQKIILTQNRGTIYEKQPPYRLVCLPFYKFWNYNEPLSAVQTVGTAQWTYYTEKLDGSFFKLYYFNKEWHISSNSRIDIKQFREKYVHCGKTNEQLWQEAATEANLDYSKLNQQYAYFFERVHPEYKIVIKYEKPMLYHLGTRDMSTLEELEIDIGVRKPRVIPFSTFDECLEYVNRMRFAEGEGIVACDLKTYDRIKIKSPSYLLVHYQTVGMENKNKQSQFCLNIWLQGEKQEYLTYFPQYTDKYNQIEQQIEQVIIIDLISDFSRIYSSEDKIFFTNLNKDHVSMGKPDLDRKRQILIMIFQQNKNCDWNSLTNEEKFMAVRNILRHRNMINNRKFTFEKALRSLIKQSENEIHS